MRSVWAPKIGRVGNVSYFSRVVVRPPFYRNAVIHLGERFYLDARRDCPVLVAALVYDHSRKTYAMVLWRERDRAFVVARHWTEFARLHWEERRRLPELAYAVAIGAKAARALERRSRMGVLGRHDAFDWRKNIGDPLRVDDEPGQRGDDHAVEGRVHAAGEVLVGH